MHAGFYKQIAAKVAAWMDFQDIQATDGELRYCDVGGGAGRTMYEMLKQRPDLSEAVLCEPSPVLFDFAKLFITNANAVDTVPMVDPSGCNQPQYLRPEALPANVVSDKVSLTLHDGVASTLDRPKEHFDVVTCFNVVDRYPDPAELIADLDALVKPGGLLVICSPMDFREDVTPVEKRVTDLEFLFMDPKWTVVGKEEMLYDFRNTARYALRFQTQVVAVRKSE